MKQNNLKKLINLSKLATIEIAKKFGIKFIDSIIFKDNTEWRYCTHLDESNNYIECIEWIESNGEVYHVELDDKVYDYHNYILISYQNNNPVFDHQYMIFDKIKQIKNLY